MPERFDAAVPGHPRDMLLAIVITVVVVLLVVQFVLVRRYPGRFRNTGGGRDMERSTGFSSPSSDPP